MLQVKREVTPILADILNALIDVAETSSWVMNTQSLIMFMSHGSAYLNENQSFHERIVKILEEQLKDALSALRMRDPVDDEEEEEEEEYEEDFNAT